MGIRNWNSEYSRKKNGNKTKQHMISLLRNLSVDCKEAKDTRTDFQYWNRFSTAVTAVSRKFLEFMMSKQTDEQLGNLNAAKNL